MRSEHQARKRLLKHVPSRSIFQKNSWAGLDISRAMLEALMRKHEMMPDLLEVVRCFQDKTCNVEEAYSGASLHRTTLRRRGLSRIFAVSSLC